MGLGSDAVDQRSDLFAFFANQGVKILLLCFWPSRIDFFFNSVINHV